MLAKRYPSSRHLDGVVDLERLQSGKKTDLERDPSKFFELTYPSDEIRLVIHGLTQRFSNKEGPGLVLAESVKGLGKSHLLLLGYHLFQSVSAASKWASEIGYAWSPPANSVVIVHKFTDQSMPDDALWLLVGKSIGASWDRKRPPSRAQLKTALGDRHLVLILDELERGIDNIGDNARRSQNLSFLQMLTEEASQSLQVTVFAAIYDGNKEPGSTLKRTPRIELRFRKPEDRAAIVRHRLFLDADSYDKNSAKVLIRSYVNVWKQFGIEASDAYMFRMESAFPFLPDLIDLVFERITVSGGFQGTRGALGLLGAMVDAAPAGTSLYTASHCRLTDAACANRLQDLDPSAHLINCASGNLRDLSQQSHAEAIASAVLMASLAPGGHATGVQKDELIRHVIKPGDDPNAFHVGIDAFARYGTYFHEREGRYLFDHGENEHAKVELEAAKGNDEQARVQITQIWQQELFKETRQSVVFTDADTTRLQLSTISTQSPRYALSPKRLSNFERHGLYQGLELRNQVLLLEPRDERVNHLANADLLTLAKRLRAAMALAESSQSAERRARFERIQREQSQQIHRLLKSSGLVYVRIERWADSAEHAQFEEENLGPACSREEVVNFLRAQVFPVAYIQEHLRGRLGELIGRKVGQIDRLYRNTLGYPVPLSVNMVAAAIRELAEDRGRLAGLQHPRGSFCGERVDLSEPELNEAVLTAPWPAETKPPASSAQPGLPLSISPGEPGAEPEPLPPSYLPTDVQEWATPSCRTLGELRQELARRLEPNPGSIVRGVRFAIFAGYRGQDLSALPAAVRGSLTGAGDLDLQLDLSLSGPMNKAELEDRCERLPNLSGASYTARVKVEMPVTAEGEP